MGDGNLLAEILGEGPFAAFVLALVAVLGAFARGLWDWLKGRHDRERTQSKDRRDLIATLKAEVRDAESATDAERARADAERALRLAHQRKEGVFWEYAQQLRRDCICKHHARPEELRAWPEVD